MAANKRTEFQREKDLAETARMYLQGWNQFVIAAKLNVCRQQVSYDIRELIKRWRAASVQDMGEARSHELARINELEKTYWEAWERSVGPKQRSTTGKKTGVSESGMPVDVNQAQIVRFDEAGDPRFLAGIERCIELRSKLLGLDAPMKIESNLTYTIKLPDDFGVELPDDAVDIVATSSVALPQPENGGAHG